jgi:hypothetical protein
MPLKMNSKVYFDTDCFHHFATTFENTPLSADLRERILLAPFTMLEVLSHLARFWGEDVLHQLRGMPNWLDVKGNVVLPFPEVEIAIIGFATSPAPPDHDAIARLNDDINVCVSSDLSTLKPVAEARDQQLKDIKNHYGLLFQHLITQLKNSGPDKKAAFTKLWLEQFHSARSASFSAPDDTTLIAAFNAHYEFEYEKALLALQNPHYNVMNHVNDLLDAESLIYLADPDLHFLTFDRGYCRKVKTSPQRSRIHQVPPNTFATPQSAEAYLRISLGC